MHAATLVLIVLVVGIASQWLAWRLRVPAIVVLIVSGLVLGPATGVVDLSVDADTLAELIGLGVAVILFEGGMALRWGELVRVRHGIQRLTVAGPVIAWLLGTIAAVWIAGLSWPVAWVMGAILVVTGPTVILPLMRQARLNNVTSSLLKWEGIVNDPVGVLLAVVAFQYFLGADGGLGASLGRLGVAVGTGALVGGLGGRATGFLFRRGLVPEHLKPSVLLGLVLAAYWISNLAQREAGLLTVTIMGVVIGNMHLVERDALRHFKENLTVILLSVLFIVIPATLTLDDLALLDARALLFVAAVMLLVRPATIALATIGADMRREDKLLLGWIAPRGIVAAATAGILGPALVDAGYPDADRLLPLVFLVILATVLAHGLTIQPLTRRLGLSAHDENGLLIVGATPWTRALARAVADLDVDVMVADGYWSRLGAVRGAGIPTYYGEILSDHAEHELEAQHLSHLLCATENDFYNALVCKARGAQFGAHRAFQLPTHQESDRRERRMTLQNRGYFAFDDRFDGSVLHDTLEQGWSFAQVPVRARNVLGALKERLGEHGQEWLLIGGTTADGAFLVHSNERPIEPRPGWTLLIYAREPERAQEAAAEEAAEQVAEEFADEASGEASEEAGAEAGVDADPQRS